MSSYPYPMKAAVEHSERNAQVQHALHLGLPWLVKNPNPQGEWLSVMAFGPSLYDTWERATKPMITCSGSLPFMTMREVTPDYHVDMDPRPHKLAAYRAAPQETRYFMATVCHPHTWQVLKDKDVTLWHFYCGAETVKWVKDNDPAHDVLHAGASVGLGCVRIGMELGYRKFKVFGMDNSFQDGMRHAGAHYGYPHEILEVTEAGEAFQTSKIMYNCAIESLKWLVGLRQCQFEVHGKGLQQTMLKEAIAAQELSHVVVVD